MIDPFDVMACEHDFEQLGDFYDPMGPDVDFTPYLTVTQQCKKCGLQLSSTKPA